MVEVTGFEPQPEAYTALQEVRAAGVALLSCAIGDGEEYALYHHGGLASLFKANRAMFCLSTHEWAKLQIK